MPLLNIPADEVIMQAAPVRDLNTNLEDFDVSTDTMRSSNNASICIKMYVVMISILPLLFTRNAHVLGGTHPMR